MQPGYGARAAGGARRTARGLHGACVHLGCRLRPCTTDSEMQVHGGNNTQWDSGNGLRTSVTWPHTSLQNPP